MNELHISPNAHASNLCPDSSDCSHYFARLMTPEAVAQATFNQPAQVRTKTSGRWLLAGDVCPEMFGLMNDMQRESSPPRITGFSSQDGIAYCTFVHQVRHFQHRFVMPLYDPAVRHFIESLSKSVGVTFSLGNDDGNEALLIPCPVRPNDFLPLLVMSSDVSLDEQLNALRELPFMLPVIGSPLLVPSLIGGVVVRHVSVSLLLPSIIDEVWRSTLDKAATE